MIHVKDFSFCYATAKNHKRALLTHNSAVCVCVERERERERKRERERERKRERVH